MSLSPSPTVATASLFRISAASGVVWVMASCASLETAAPPVDQLALPPKADRAKLAQGRQILAEHCVKCHGAPRIAKHSAQDWSDEILPEMTQKAKLTPQEAALVKNYVMTAHEALAAKPQG